MTKRLQWENPNFLRLEESEKQPHTDPILE